MVAQRADFEERYDSDCSVVGHGLEARIRLIIVLRDTC